MGPTAKLPNCLTVIGTASWLRQPTAEPTVTVMDWGSKAPPETVTRVMAADDVLVAVRVAVVVAVGVAVVVAVGVAVVDGVVVAVGATVVVALGVFVAVGETVAVGGLTPIVGLAVSVAVGLGVVVEDVVALLVGVAVVVVAVASPSVVGLLLGGPGMSVAAAGVPVGGIGTAVAVEVGMRPACCTTTNPDRFRFVPWTWT